MRYLRSVLDVSATQKFFSFFHLLTDELENGEIKGFSGLGENSEKIIMRNYEKLENGTLDFFQPLFFTKKFLEVPSISSWIDYSE